ncbi:hypothetical protein EDB86DRAFT_2834543 [Lactarius hatsudake]|nr:hypothetical protein EDB86DRAFT_2834543 [Lactarius hatsudake]
MRCTITPPPVLLVPPIPRPSLPPVRAAAPSPRPLPSPFAQKGYARGHAAPGPFPLGHAERGMARDPQGHSTSAPAPSLLSAPPRTRGRGMRRWPPPSLSHSRGRGAHDGTPPRLSTSPPAPALPSSCHPDASLPIGRATPSARGTRVHAAPGSTRAEGVHAGTLRRMRGKGACDPRPHPSPFARKGVHAGTPLRSREQRLTRPSRVRQQDRRGLRAPAFTMPAPHFRTP